MKWSNICNILPRRLVLEFFCFIFIAILVSSFNPCAFPEELKSKQTTIKLIEAARYQLRCSHPRQQNRPLTLQDPYSPLPVKIQFTASSRWPSFWLALCEWLWLKHSQAWLPCWWSPPAVGQPPTRQTGSTLRVLSSLQRVFLCICFQRWYQIVSRVLIGFLVCFPSVGNHLGSMVHQRWGEHDVFILVLSLITCLNKICLISRLIVRSEPSASLVSCGFACFIELLITSSSLPGLLQQKTSKCLIKWSDSVSSPSIHYVQYECHHQYWRFTQCLGHCFRPLSKFKKGQICLFHS